MKKVLLICPFARPNLGGVESHLDKLLNFLAKKNVYVYLLTYQPLSLPIRGKKFEQGKNYEIHRFDWFGTGWFNKLENSFPLTFAYLFPGLFMKSFIFFMRRPKQIDCIHAHGLAAAAMAKVIKWFFPIRIVVSTHAIYRFPQRKILSGLIKWVLSSFDFILAVGEESRKELIEIGLNENKIAVHPNWIDTNIFKPLDKDKARKVLKIPKDKFVVLFVGRLIAKKGILTLIEVAKKVSKNIIFIVVGAGGPETPWVDQAARTLENFIFIEKLPSEVEEKQKILARYYNSADIFVLPSLYPEGFAAVILEGIACGTPIIATDKGCVPQIIDSSVGVLIDPTESNLRTQIEYFYQHKDELAKKARHCRGYALKHFSDKNAEVIFKSYNLASQ